MMNRIFLLVSAVLMLNTSCVEARHRTTTAPADTVIGIPEAYYAPVDGLCGKALKQALATITRQHEVFSYGSLWYYYESTDVVPGTDNQVFDYYSPWTYYFTGLGTAPDGANKEHACPQSWWGGGALCKAYTDLFNVMPSEVVANSAKSNYPLGIVEGTPSFQNSHMRVGASARSQYSGSVFEPCDEYKGDFARLYFYVATTYADAAWGSKESVAHTVAFKTEDYPTVKSWILDLLMQWNAQDPVSEWEITRNERVFSQQHNRNPFIDYPQLADYIWGNKAQQPFDLAQAQVNGEATGEVIGGLFPDDGSTGGNDTDTDNQPIGGEDIISTILLDEDFSSITSGKDSDTGSSSLQWAGNDNFPTVSSAFQAGGVVRLGSSKNAGRLQSRSLGNAGGESVVVLIQVKGWSKVEGNLLVTLSGQDTRTVSYSHTLSDGYEVVQVQFSNCQPQSILTIATSEKRAFITAVRVGIEGGSGSEGISMVHSDRSSVLTYNLMGQPVTSSASGLHLERTRGLRPMFYR